MSEDSKEYIVKIPDKYIIVDDAIINLSELKLIRCKDCEYYNRRYINLFIRGSDCSKGIIDTIVPDKDFCSRANEKTICKNCKYHSENGFCSRPDENTVVVNDNDFCSMWEEKKKWWKK